MKFTKAKLEQAFIELLNNQAQDKANEPKSNEFESPNNNIKDIDKSTNIQLGFDF